MRHWKNLLNKAILLSAFFGFQLVPPTTIAYANFSLNRCEKELNKKSSFSAQQSIKFVNLLYKFKLDPSEQTGNKLKKLLQTGTIDFNLVRETLHEKLIEDSSNLLHEIATHPNSALKTPDVLIIGDGVHAAIAALTLRKNYPELKVLTLTQGLEVGGTFARTGGFYRLNSPETHSLKTHRFPNSPIELLDLSNEGYVPAAKLGDLITYLIYASSDVLLAQSVNAIRLGSSNLNSAGYRVELNSGLILRPTSIINATGLGQVPFFDIFDDKTKKSLTNLYLKSNSKQSRDPQELEDYFSIAEKVTRAIEQKTTADIWEAYKDQRVGIIGGGGAGATVVEAFSGYGPGRIYGNPTDGEYGVKQGPGIGEISGAKSVDWWGVNFDSPESLGVAFNQRYKDSLQRDEVYSKVGFKKERAQSIEIIKENGNTVFKVTGSSGDVSNYDRLIVSTGYSTQPIHWTKNETPIQMNKVPVMGSLSNKIGTFVVATSFETSDSPLSINVGPAAGNLASPEEIQASLTNTGMSLDVLSERTESAASMLGEFLVKHGLGQKNKSNKASGDF